jgi:hypothetical protein
LESSETIGAASIEPSSFFEDETAPSRHLAAVALVLLTAVFFISVFYHPGDGQYFSLCGFKTVTGLPCPGCGLTHSFCALGKGAIGQAVEYNLLGPALFLAGVLLWFRSLSVLVGRYGPVALVDRIALRYRLPRVFLWAFLTYGASRIVYLLIWHPAVAQNSPLARLVAHLIG